MEQCYLMPGQERCEKIKDANGVPKISYSYRSLQGGVFPLCEPQCGGGPEPLRGLACDPGPLLPQLTHGNKRIFCKESCSRCTGGSGSLFVCGRKTAIQTKKKSENLAKLWAIVPGENNIRWGELTTFLIPGIMKHDIMGIC